MLVTSHKIAEMYFRLLGTNDFPVKAENEKNAAGEILFAWLRQKVARKSVLNVQHDYFSSFNQSYHWFLALSFLKLSNSTIWDEDTI